jgi:hypothetical protein
MYIMGYIIKDSGLHAQYDTGAKRDNPADKGAFDLVPWETIWHLAEHYEKGAKKYAERNWEKGIPISRYFQAAIRHMIQFYMGMDDENHLIAAIWNMIGMYQTKLWIQRGELPEELDDLPYKVDIPQLVVILEAFKESVKE